MSNYLQQIIIIAFGTLGSQFLIFGYMPFMTSHFRPELIGEYNFLFSLASILGTVLGLRFELAIIVDDKDQAVNNFWICLLFSLVLSLPVILVLSFFYSSSLSLFVVLFSLSFWLIQALTNLLNVGKQYILLSLSRILISLIFILIGFSYVNFKFENGSLFEFHTLSYLLVSVWLLTLVFIKYKPNKITLKEIRVFYEDSKRFAYYIFPATLLNQFSRLSLPLLIPIWYGNHQAGLYAIASKLVMFPLALLSYSVGMVFRREALADLSNKGCCSDVFNKTLKYLLLFMCFYVAGVLFLFKPLYNHFFTNTWDEVVDYSIILIPYCSAGILYGPISQAFLIMKKQKIDFIFQFLMFISVFLVFVLGYYLKLDFSHSLALFSVTGGIIQLLGLYVCHRIVSSKPLIKNASAS